LVPRKCPKCKPGSIQRIRRTRGKLKSKRKRPPSLLDFRSRPKALAYLWGGGGPSSSPTCACKASPSKPNSYRSGGVSNADPQTFGHNLGNTCAVGVPSGAPTKRERQACHSQKSMSPSWPRPKGICAKTVLRDCLRICCEPRC